MNNFFSQIKKELKYYWVLFLRLGILLGVYGLLRILFLIFNFNHFDLSSGTEVLKVFLLGIRFDLAAIAFFNSIVIVLHLLPFNFRRNKSYQLAIKICFYFFNTLALLIAISDLEYYQFNFKRIDVGSLSLLGTLPSLSNSFIKEFWYLILILIFLLALMEFFYRKIKWNRVPKRLNLPMQTLLFLVGIGLCILIMRGGWSVQIPIRTISVSKGIPPKLIPLATNSPFTFYRSLMSYQIKERKYLEPAVANQVYSIGRNYGKQQFNKLNVVVFLLESFSKVYVGSLNGNRGGYTPFLDSLIAQGVVCTNAFANGRRSNQGLVSVVSGIPPMMEVPYMYSSYAGNSQNSLPSLLKEQGYNTAFFNGSNKDMLNWESYIYFSGFKHYYSREDYNNDTHHDGGWGIYDHYFLQYIANKLNSFEQPFCTTVLTLSSHHPYTVPPNLEGFHNDTIGRYLNALKYSDYSLKKFFETASEQPWFNNTLFVFSADHTAVADGISPDEKREGPRAFQKNRVGLYAIPLLFYQPNSGFKGKLDFPVQQIDIMPSVLDLLGYPQKFTAFGESVFRGSTDKKYSFNYVNGIYQILDENNLLLFNGEAPIAMYNYQKDSLLTTDLLTESPEEANVLTQKIKAVIQTYHHTLINNKYFWNQQDSSFALAQPPKK